MNWRFKYLKIYVSQKFQRIKKFIKNFFLKINSYI